MSDVAIAAYLALEKRLCVTRIRPNEVYPNRKISSQSKK
jgi:hypothetical protein